MESSIFFQIVVWLIPALFAIVLHEVAHGWAASKLGDTTARDLGRLSLNPLRHVDPVGTFIVPLLMAAAKMPFVFGWAKPVPVNFSRLRNLRTGTVLVALAGPLANVLMIFFWLLLLYPLATLETSGFLPTSVVLLLEQISISGVLVNLALMVFNLFPLPPLDGGRIVGAILPPKFAKPYMRLEKFGIFILLALIATGVFNRIFQPVFGYLLDVISRLVS
ncbi:MAG: site-2 protease family protein [Alphaproteobacteria bacterium]|nr:site-2 protease family protein [Alphaproteobacteria bacterium]